ncbi:hypothetical protein BJV82DRAFT_83496 [Fennellomyces sp. T-0311]|nr:hypothetical protein BJV82DRAFT_83496 [Fennellomyces sp. T-0311]
MAFQRFWNHARSFATKSSITNNEAREKLRMMEKQILDEYMVPGKYLRYFKAHKKPPKSLVQQDVPVGLDHVHKKSARSVNMDENDSAPTVAQQRLAQRIHRGLNKMFAIESLPTRWVTASYVSVHTVKVSRNLRKCYILYEPATDAKHEKGHVHRALQTHAGRLEQMVRAHAGLRRPLSIKFVSDTQTSALETIFKKISAEPQSLTK